MKILLDENLPESLVSALRQLGHHSEDELVTL
jgi:predicted nuclease of predicted toxin-antitoxin system